MSTEETPGDPPRPSVISSILTHSAFRYLLVGVLSFVVDIGGLYILRDVAGWPTWIASAVAFLMSFVVNFALQRWFSFGGQAPYGRSLVKYVLLVAANTVVTAGIVSAFDAVDLWIVGKVVSTASMTVWNYFLYRYWVFRAPRGDAPGRV